MPSAVARAAALGAADEIGAFERRIAALPTTHPRWIGLWLLRLGMAFFLPACITGPAGPNICLAVAGAGYLLSWPPWRALVGLRWGLAFLAWVWLSALLAYMLGDGRWPMHGVGLSYTWSAVLLAQIAYRCRPVLQAGLWAMLALVGVSAALGLAQFLLGCGDGLIHLARRGLPYEHGVGFYSLHLTQGPVMAVCSLLFACAGCVGLLRPRWARMGTACAIGGLLFSTSRMAYIGAVAGWWLWRGLGSWRRLALAAALVGASAALALAFLLWVQPAHTLRALHGQDNRWYIWNASLAIVAEHPVVGAGGPEGYKDAYNAAFARVNPGVDNEFAKGGGAPHAHNSLISIAAEHGIIAVPLYLALVASILLALWRGRRACLAAWRLGASVAAVMLVAGMFEHLAGHAVPADVLFVVLGLALALEPALAKRSSAAELAPAHRETMPSLGSNGPGPSIAIASASASA